MFGKKILLLAVIFLTSLMSAKVRAEDTQSINTRDLARILIHNPVKEINGFPACNDNLSKSVVKEISSGVISYELTFMPGGFCDPVKAIVTIVEDSSKKAVDEPTTYKVSLELK